uniref:Ankyrin repeat and SOCS box containing 10 n=1 Tax=Callorhinchus milii TaxID=7868 RepID=A0A4W3GQ57_CALMI
ITVVHNWLLRFAHKVHRLWSLSYRPEFTTPLHITASRGFGDCLRHLLCHGAEVDFAPGGKTALHEACEHSQADCVRLLLSYGANPNSVSEDGYTPLHLCSAPESKDKGDSALHVAARFGLEEHVRLYLGRGARVDLTNESGETPLHAACSQPHSEGDMERYHTVCRALMDRGAPACAMDGESRSPLHLACRNANHRVVTLLLQAGADVNLMDYGAVAYTLPLQPERSVKALLNYGAILWVYVLRERELEQQQHNTFTQCLSHREDIPRPWT